ncbi:DUF4190 domain-containing protein [Alkalicoccus saliphilus]|uniref:DUF4190 domain-containing protein n=1 Tax=Alkalicoccus saliphilus TaxID=200989 RepID=A0A2T4U9R6_9BACI|nr:DUF4190 domain-containing protein [Alkalicoccus saliphilus]PTL40144.1 hypothetical protein C6Y45_01835 [Alkalicoccus saliphilus]
MANNDRLEPVKDENNIKAVVSLVIGIISILFTFLIGIFGLPLAAAGLVIGILALRDIKRNNQPGRGTAVAGIVCSSIGILLPVIFIVLAFTVFQNMPQMPVQQP